VAAMKTGHSGPTTKDKYLTGSSNFQLEFKFSGVMIGPRWELFVPGQPPIACLIVSSLNSKRMEKKKIRWDHLGKGIWMSFKCRLW
jgi:hypothetical protein